jgi:hypothetical protein
MKRAGINRGVIISFTPDNRQLKNLNFWTVAITRQKKTKPATYPMFTPFISVSPTMTGRKPVEELDHKLKWGMKGVKIHPIAQGFPPDDKRMWPVYQWLVDHNMPIIAHSGVNVVEDEQTDLARPHRWLSVLKAFPNLKLILAHMGGGCWQEAIDVAKKYPQVMFDTSIAISYRRADSLLDNKEAVKMIRTIGVNRVMFGTDYPWVDPVGNIERIFSLALMDEEKQKILGGNAARLLRLE